MTDMIELTGSEAFTGVKVNGSSFSCPQAAVDEIERLREKVLILEAEIRVMKDLPQAINDAMDIASDGSNVHEKT